MPFLNKNGTTTKIVKISIYDKNEVYTYDSLHEASVVSNLPKSAIVRSCKMNAKVGKIRYRAGDYYFTFIDNIDINTK